MRLYIHTYGRADRQTTLERLPAEQAKNAVLVVQQREAKAYAAYAERAEVLVLPDHIRSLSPTRQWILDTHDVRKHGPKLLLLDDDLREFAKRRTDDLTLFTQCTPRDVADIYRQLDRALDKYAHAGVLAREGGNRHTAPFSLATRMMRMLGYHVPTVRAVGARFDRVPCKQDFDMTLQLLRAGYPNYVIGKYIQAHHGSNTAGGCSSYRTRTMMDKAARTLCKLHAPFVTLVQKETKSAWVGADGLPATRTEVIVQWKRALESSGYTLTKPRALVQP